MELGNHLLAIIILIFSSKNPWMLKLVDEKLMHKGMLAWFLS